VTTPRGFTSLPTAGGVYFFGFYSKKQTKKQTNKRRNAVIDIKLCLTILKILLKDGKNKHTYEYVHM